MENKDQKRKSDKYAYLFALFTIIAFMIAHIIVGRAPPLWFD